MTSLATQFKKGRAPWNKGLTGFLAGRRLSDETKAKISLANRGENSAKWKGDNVGYIALHNWIQKWGPKVKSCQHCGGSNCRLEWANLSGEYHRDINDFIKLCVKCHKKMDSKK